MFSQLALLFSLFITSTSFVIPQLLANCAPPNGTDTHMNWWQCNNGPAQFLNVTPYDATGANYEYPLHLSQALTMKIQINNPKNTYAAGNLKSTMNVWKYGGWGGCVWSAVPTFGLLKNIDACSDGVPCPINVGVQEMDIKVDFSKFESVISLLKDNTPYQLEYILHDTASGDDACLMIQALAFIK